MVLLRCKLVFFGDSKTGKTSFIRQLIERNFQFEYDLTYGCEFSQFKVQIKRKIEEEHDENSEEPPEDKWESNVVELFIMDISGSRMYTKQVPLYSENMNFFVLMYDVTNAKSFENLKHRWIKYGRPNYRNTKQQTQTVGAKKKLVPGVLIGNKTDLKDKQVVSFLNGKQFATTNHLDFFEISSMDYKEVKEVVDRICVNYIMRYKESLETVKYLSEQNQ